MNALRSRGRAVGAFKLEADLDTLDQLGFSNQNLAHE